MTSPSNNIVVGDLVYDPYFKCFGLITHVNIGVGNHFVVHWHTRDLHEQYPQAEIKYLKEVLDKIRES